MLNGYHLCQKSCGKLGEADIQQRTRISIEADINPKSTVNAISGPNSDLKYPLLIEWDSRIGT